MRPPFALLITRRSRVRIPPPLYEKAPLRRGFSWARGLRRSVLRTNFLGPHPVEPSGGQAEASQGWVPARGLFIPRDVSAARTGRVASTVYGTSSPRPGLPPPE